MLISTPVQSLSNFACKFCMMRGGTLLILVMGLKVKVNLGTLCIKSCWHDTDYSFCPIAFKLHMQVVDDERRNPIDSGLQGQRSRSTFGLCETSGA